MSEQNKDLAAFEEYLVALVNNASDSKPLTTEEVAAILQNYGPPEKISVDEKEALVKLMKDAYEAKLEVKRRFKYLSLIPSLCHGGAASKVSG